MVVWVCFFVFVNFFIFLFSFFFLGSTSWLLFSVWGMKVGWGWCFFAIGNVINVSFSFLFFRGHFLNLDFGLGYEGKLGVVFFFAIGNVINVPFSFFSLGDASYTWILAWAMKVSWVVFFFTIRNVINIPFSFFFFRGRFLNVDFGFDF